MAPPDPVPPALPAPPPAMGAVLDHAGVTWRYGHQTGVAVIAGAVSLASLAAVVGGVVVGVWLGVGVAAVVGGVAVLVLLQALRRNTLRLTSRNLTVQGLTLGHRDRWDLRIDDLEEVNCAMSDRGDWALVIRTKEERAVVAAGQPEAWLKWLASAVDHARARSAQREAVDGREWAFLRTAPEDLTRLTDGEGSKGG